MMRRVLFLMMVLAVLPFIGACKEKAGELDDPRFKAVTSFTVIADMAREVGGEAVIVESITKPGAEIHDYQPTPQDIVKTLDADLILWNGLNLERWFKRFLQDVEGVPDVVVSGGVEPISIYGGAYDGKPNPHAWMSPVNAMIYIDNIANAFAIHDPENESLYRSNAQKYKAKLQNLHESLMAQFDLISPQQRWLATSEGAFSYLARDYGLKELYLWPINADQQGTPQQVRALIDQVNEHGIPVIFSESTVSGKPARQVAQETGAHYGGVLYVDSLSGSDGPVPSYEMLLKVTSETILNGFKEAKAKSE